MCASEAPCIATAEGAPGTGPWFPESPGAAADDTPQHIQMLCTSPAFQRHAEERTAGQRGEQLLHDNVERIAARLRVYEVSRVASPTSWSGWLTSRYRGGSHATCTCQCVLSCTADVNPAAHCQLCTSIRRRCLRLPEEPCGS